MTPPSAAGCRLDHLVVVAADLERGAHEISARLGVPLQPGGVHPAMATHNRLLRLGDDAYLEVIAPTHALPPPARRRWFGLDDVAPAALARLATWAVRSSDVAATAAAAAEPLGDVEALSRGALHWRITVPGDGGLVLGGAAPAIIEWPPQIQIAPQLNDVGCALRRLEIHHPDPDRVRALFRSLSIDERDLVVTALPAGAAPYLAAYVDTPHGTTVIDGR